MGIADKTKRHEFETRELRYHMGIKHPDKFEGQTTLSLEDNAIVRDIVTYLHRYRVGDKQQLTIYCYGKARDRYEKANPGREFAIDLQDYRKTLDTLFYVISPRLAWATNTILHKLAFNGAKVGIGYHTLFTLNYDNEDVRRIIYEIKGIKSNGRIM